jgi:hypothetical protein
MGRNFHRVGHWKVQRSCQKLRKSSKHRLCQSVCWILIWRFAGSLDWEAFHETVVWSCVDWRRRTWLEYFRGILKVFAKSHCDRSAILSRSFIFYHNSNRNRERKHRTVTDGHEPIGCTQRIVSSCIERQPFSCKKWVQESISRRWSIHIGHVWCILTTFFQRYRINELHVYVGQKRINQKFPIS